MIACADARLSTSGPGARRFFPQHHPRSRSGLLPLESPWRYCRLIRARWETPRANSCCLGARRMSGVIAAMRRTLLSCSSLARNGLIGFATGALPFAAPAWAADSGFLRHDLDPVRIQPAGSGGADHGAGPARLFRAGGDPVDAHPHPRREERITATCRHRGPAAPGRPLPRAVVRRAANPDLVGRRRQPPADIGRHLPSDAAGHAATHPRLRNLAAAGTCAADGPCGRGAARERRRVSAQPHHLQRPRHRGDGARGRRPGHRADSRTLRAPA